MNLLNADTPFNEVYEYANHIAQRNPGYRAILRSDPFNLNNAIGVYNKELDKTFIYHENPIDSVERLSNDEFIKMINNHLAILYPSKSSKSSKIDWDKRMLKMAAGEINTWSKDPSTKVSATIFKGKYPIASSYNGFPPGIEDTKERLNNRELKYKLVQHAEANAIATCSKLGISTDGATMAVTHFPCSTCAGLMISAGIKKVIVQKPDADFLSRWKDSVELSEEMFKEADVQLVVIDLKESA